MNAEQFWSKVLKTEGCWIWQGQLNWAGYGAFVNSRKTTLAHRFAYELLKGPIPKGLHVCHHCDNPRCVNPAHLFLGTPLSNAQDRNKKQRQARGERMNTHKLTVEQVQEIRRLRKGGMKLSDIAVKFGVTPVAVHYIGTRETWGWLN